MPVSIRDEIAMFLEAERIRLHPNKVHLTRTADGLDCLGYRVFPHRIRVRGDNGYRFRRRLRAKARDYARGRLDLGEVQPSVAAWIGHVSHADSEGLRRAVLGGVSFQRATDRALCSACGSRGRLEQQTGEHPVGQPQQEQPG